MSSGRGGSVADQYWLVNEIGDTYALVTGAKERDRLVPLGWAETEEPSEGWVHIWREGIEQPGRVPVSALPDLWGPRGWVAGPPPDGMHSIAPEAPVAQPAETKPEPKPAAGGDAKKE